MSLQPQPPSLVPFTTELKARRIREKIRFIFERPEFIVIAPILVEEHNDENGDPQVAAGHVARREGTRFKALPPPKLIKNKPEKPMNRRRSVESGGVGRLVGTEMMMMVRMVKMIDDIRKRIPLRSPRFNENRTLITTLW
jgi:hypothetical protein